MRERLVAAFVGLTVVVVALFGIPRAYYVADLVRSQEQARVDRTADLVAAVVDEREADGRPVDPAFLDALTRSGESIVVDVSGTPVRSSGATGQDEGDVSAASRLADGGTVTVTRDGGSVDAEVGHALLPLALLGVLLALLAAAAGLVLADRFARPFRALAQAAHGLGAAERPALPDYRMPEARAIAKGLATGGERLEALVEHERELVVHASHELRTPVTALRLALEDLSLWPETTPAIATELQRAVGELDRLSDVIGELLATSRDLSASAEIDLDLEALVAHTVAATVRSVVHTRTGPLPVRLDPTPVVAALKELLVDGSRVTVSDRGSHLQISITGSAAQPPDGPAEDLVAAAGGRLTHSGDELLVLLPKRPAAGAGDHDLVR
ncbi:histidine kinase dimerization/phospho-acceptor domain-containing protein [Nocardioides panacisoli]|uniref:histidine kinase n=1 Tax=Nocardioides panacisoli TaxID=627624 RepID=A0ABP7I895_9ACTN